MASKATSKFKSVEARFTGSDPSLRSIYKILNIDLSSVTAGCSHLRPDLSSARRRRGNKRRRDAPMFPWMSKDSPGRLATASSNRGPTHACNPEQPQSDDIEIGAGYKYFPPPAQRPILRR